MVKRCFVAGYPIRQSRSPLIHGHWIAERRLDATYERIEVPPEDLPRLLERVRSGEFLGGNLTIPLKQAVMPLLDQITEAAEVMGAVNTVYLEDGKLTGANTDVAGFFAHLDRSCPGWDNEPASVLVLGAGGAARAIVHGLTARHVRRLGLANRSQERADALLADIVGRMRPGFAGEVMNWPVATASISQANLVINATSLGMKGQPPLDLAWPDQLTDTIAYDIVYAPLMTPFLVDAQARGARIVDGLGMLLHQAALAFAHWFGETPQVTPELRALIEADLSRDQAGGS